MEVRKLKEDIIKAGESAVKELIKVAKEDIIKKGLDDRLKNAAATKKLAIFDAFEILTRIENEKNMLAGKTTEKTEQKLQGFAERRSK